MIPVAEKIVKVKLKRKSKILGFLLSAAGIRTSDIGLPQLRPSHERGDDRPTTEARTILPPVLGGEKGDELP